MTEQLVNLYLYPAAMTLLASFGAWVMAKAAAWLQANVKNTYLNGVLSRMLSYADLAVSTTVRELGPAVRDALADGKITTEERAVLEQKARGVMRQLWGNVDRAAIEKALGKDELERMLDAAVDQALVKLEAIWGKKQ